MREALARPTFAPRSGPALKGYGLDRETSTVVLHTRSRNSERDRASLAEPLAELLEDRPRGDFLCAYLA
jgi:hypothetical protein